VLSLRRLPRAPVGKIAWRLWCQSCGQPPAVWVTDGQNDFPYMPKTPETGMFQNRYRGSDQFWIIMNQGD